MHVLPNGAGRRCGAVERLIARQGIGYEFGSNEAPQFILIFICFLFFLITDIKKLLPKHSLSLYIYQNHNVCFPMKNHLNLLFENSSSTSIDLDLEQSMLKLIRTLSYH